MKLGDRKDRRRACFALAASGHVRIEERLDGAIELRLPDRPLDGSEERPGITFDPFTGQWQDRLTGRQGQGFFALCRAFGFPIEVALTAINSTTTEG